MAIDCSLFNNFLFRRTPNWDKKLAEDRFPHDYTYLGLYPTMPWPSFTGDTHYWDRVHVTRPNDDGCWDAVTATNCLDAPCDPSRKYVCWGSTRNSYGKYRARYNTPPFCYDQLRHVEEAVAQLNAIVKGLQDMPDEIVSDFVRYHSVTTADFIWVCGSSLTKVAVTANMFTNGCKRINMGSNANLPTSKLTMQYLERYAPYLMYQGYFKNQFVEQPKFELMTDLTTASQLANANPALTGMYQSADFTKGGKYFALGAMMGCGNFLFHIDKTPLRFQNRGNGSLERVWPYENVATTVGMMPQFDEGYENAEYQLYHVYNRGAREIHVGETPSVHPLMKFASRSLMGKWSWKSPDYFKLTNPTNGQTCEYNNDMHDKGYFVGDYELGIKTVYPEIEMWILAQREPGCVVDDPRCSAEVTTDYQDLTPYCNFCIEA